MKEAVFLVACFVSVQLKGFQTCAFAKASPTTKNPRSAPLHHFCQCLKMPGGPVGLVDGGFGRRDAALQVRQGRLTPLFKQALAKFFLRIVHYA
jgi:hypothetical protein